jgi:hypothetical protein
MLGLNIGEPGTADSFVQEVVEKFKAQRMSSPPDTSMLLVTIVGEMPASHFAAHWRQLATVDPILKFFMSQMTKAEVLRDIAAGQTLETASLVQAPSA